jgi:hypothetical protein
MQESPADQLTGLILEIRRIIVHPDLQVAAKLTAIADTVSEAEPGIEPG